MNSTVNSMKWLVRREFWEHKGSLLWAPIAAAVLMVTLIGGAAIWKFGIQGRPQTRIEINGRVIQLGEVWNNIGAAQKAEVVEGIANGPWLASAPIMLVMAFVVFFYCLSALYDERRDRSILFWKSLPLSDALTVGSKVLVATVVAPVIAVAVSTLASLALLLIGALVALNHGLNVFGDVLAHPSFWVSPFKLLALVPAFALCALPTVGWLMLVSAWARSKVFLWAVGAPLMLGAIIKWSEMLGSGLSARWYMENIVLQLLGRVLPPGWLAFGHLPNPGRPEGMHVQPAIDTGSILSKSYQLLLEPQVLIGIAAGAAMLYVAARLRRWKE